MAKRAMTQTTTASDSGTPDYSAPVDIVMELGVPMTQRGHPALRDHVPKRFITRAEARARGWSRYWSGEACRAGHQACVFRRR